GLLIFILKDAIAQLHAPDVRPGGLAQCVDLHDDGALFTRCQGPAVPNWPGTTATWSNIDNFDFLRARISQCESLAQRRSTLDLADIHAFLRDDQIRSAG